MANVAPTIIPNVTGDNSVMSIVWTPLTSANTAGNAVAFPQWRDRTVAITGTFDSCTVVLEGSLDGTNYFTLSDPQGNAISKTAAALEAVSEMVRFVRPSVSSAGASTSITVTLLAYRADGQRGR